jgi:peroxiredoxin
MLSRDLQVLASETRVEAMALDPILDQTFETTAGPRAVRQMIEGDIPTVFISYPMDFTPVCTMQLCSYRDHWESLAPLKCRWWGINQANPALHGSFKEKKKLPFELISDKDGALLKALGLWGIFRTKRGFAVVAPSGEILGVTSIFPFFYQGYKSVIDFVSPLIKQVELKTGKGNITG